MTLEESLDGLFERVTILENSYLERAKMGDVGVRMKVMIRLGEKEKAIWLAKKWYDLNYSVYQSTSDLASYIGGNEELQGCVNEFIGRLESGVLSMELFRAKLKEDLDTLERTLSLLSRSLEIYGYSEDDLTGEED
ncbi:MAG: hypothetical protein Q8P81_04240 [Nanoarchaeota archaeon]|nr:hypothetical protein [Nanoarchaeota archaeon]